MQKIIVLLLCLGFIGCVTTSRVAQNISLGMTTNEVCKVAGKPFYKNVIKDKDGNVIEEWTYRETTWDDAGWSWDKTLINTVVVFKNGKVESFGKEGKDRYKTKNPMAPTLNVDVTTHNE